mgnify:FL=1
MHISIGKFNLTLGFNNGNQFFNSRHNFMLGQQGAVWIDTEKPRELYETIAELYNPVNKLAAMFSNAEIKVLDKDGNDVGTTEFYTLIQNPNFAQSMNEWLYSYLVQKLVYGNTFMYKNTVSPLAKSPSALWNLSPAYITPVFTGKTFDQVSLDGVIKEYEYCENNSGNAVKKYAPNTIMYTKITDIDNPFIGRSPLIALRFPLTNTKLAYEYRNVIMGRRGAIGMLSPELTKDGMGGGIPFLPAERERITNQHLNTYGVQDGKQPLLISDSPLKWTPMTYPTKDLLLFEEIDANFMTILDTLGVNRNIYKNSTFENQKAGLIQTYEDTVIPHADEFGQALTKFLGITNGRITLTYNHLSIMQSDKGKESETLAKNVQSIVQLYEKNIINKVGAVQMLISVSGIEIDKPIEDTIDKLNRMDALVANAVIKQLLVDEIRALVDAGGIKGGNVRPVEADAQFNSFGPGGQ